MAKCAARSKRTGKHCGAWAVRGSTVCIRHGASAPQVKAKAKRRLQEQAAEKAMAVLGVPREVDPHVALLEEVHRTAGHVSALQLIVSDLERERLIGGVTKTVQAPDGGRTVTVEAALSIWLRLYHSERKHLLVACNTAIRCGVEQSRVELQRREGALMADILRAVFGDPELGLSADQRQAAPVIAARHLRLASEH